MPKYRFDPCWLLAILLVLLAALVGSQPAHAVPAFARQTGVPCGMCHAPPPSLTTFGRRFKMSGYTFATADPPGPRVSAFVMSTQTWLKDASPAPVLPNNAPVSGSRLEVVSLSAGGPITESLGGFATLNYDGFSNRASLGNLELRHTRNTNVGRRNVLFGLTLNNNPGFQDPWNSTSQRFWPYIGSRYQPQVARLGVDGLLAGRVLGLSGSAFIDDQLLLEAGFYRGLGDGLQDTLGVDRTGAADLENTAIYARVMREQPLRFGSFSYGASLLSADLTAPGRPAADSIRDIGIDAMFQRNRGMHDYTLAGNFVRERLDTERSRRIGAALRSAQDLDRVQLSANYLYRKTWGIGLGYTRLWGDADPLYYASPGGRPDYGALRFDAIWNPLSARPLKFNPLLSTRLGLQYVHYDRFAGSSGLVGGRRASDNDTFTAYWIIVF